jgi:pyruvate formate lyase activating enzyme
MSTLHHEESCFCKDFHIKGFIETSFVDWPGNISSVVFLPNCNFRCSYCHNSDLVLRPDMIQDIDFDRVIERLRNLRGWVDGVCVSGGEPTIHSYLPDLLRAFRQSGFATKLDTNGSRPAVLASLIEENLLDYVAMDVKGPLVEEAYCSVTGVRNFVDDVKQSISLLLNGTVPYEFRFTVVPTYHRPEDIFRVAQELCGAKKLRLQNFKPVNTLDPLLKTCRSYDAEEITSYQQKVDQIISQEVH